VLISTEKNSYMGEFECPICAFWQVADFKTVSRCMSKLLKETFVLIYVCVGFQLFASIISIYVCLCSDKTSRKLSKVNTSV
jgi:hypothetical protein